MYISRKHPTTNDRDLESSLVHQRERVRRIAAMWRRFYPAAIAAGLKPECTNNTDSQLRTMRRAVRNCTLDFTVDNCLEASDLRLDDKFEPKPCKPSLVLQGPSKLPLFIQRIEAGEELFHEMDGEL